MRSAIKALVVTAAAVFAGGCPSTTENMGPQDVFRPAKSMRVAAVEYRVAPPDKLAIRAPGIKEFDGLSTIIRPDDRILVGILGEVYVADMTPDQIGRTLTELAAKYYNGADLRVDVTEYASKFYYVYGLPSSVGAGGKKPFTGGDTVVGALAAALMGEDAWPENVSLARPGKNGQPNSVTRIDFIRMVATGDISQNYLLEEGDMIRVPDTPMSDFRKSVQNLIPVMGAPGAVPRPGGR